LVDPPDRHQRAGSGCPDQSAEKKGAQVASTLPYPVITALYAALTAAVFLLW